MRNLLKQIPHIFFHFWGKWEDYQKGTSYNGWPTVVQVRVCSFCNKKQMRSEVSYS